MIEWSNVPLVFIFRQTSSIHNCNNATYNDRESCNNNKGYISANNHLNLTHNINNKLTCIVLLLLFKENHCTISVCSVFPFTMILAHIPGCMLTVVQIIDQFY